MALSDAQILEEYREGRDTVLQAISAGDSYIKIKIRNREWEASDPIKVLEWCEKKIIWYENRANAKAGKSRNNYARLRR